MFLMNLNFFRMLNVVQVTTTTSMMFEYWTGVRMRNQIALYFRSLKSHCCSSVKQRRGISKEARRVRTKPGDNFELYSNLWF